MRRVVITGIGPVCAGQIGKEGFFQMLLDKRPLLQPVPEAFEKHYTFRSRFFVPYVALEGYERSMEEVGKLALACTGLALEDAGLPHLAGAAVLLGVGMGSLSTGFTSYQAHATGKGRYNRLVIPMQMPNAPAAWVSLQYGADRDCVSINAACASGTVAIGESYRKIAYGLEDMVLTGGVECLQDPCGAVMRGFDSLMALSTAVDGLPCPFSLGRSGFLFNMGAGCVLVLEERERALARGAQIYAEVGGYASNTCASSIVQMPGGIEPLLPLFQLAQGRRIDYFNAHGTGTEQNDLLEAQLIQRVWGDKQPFVGATKGIIGHSIGASGALEAAATALSIARQQVHGNLTQQVIEGLNCPLESQPLEIETALSASYGFGGHNAMLLLQRHAL